VIFESKWMIYSCALALIVGVAIISPLLILNTQFNPFPENPQVYPNPQSQMGQIAVNIESVKVELGTITSPIGPNSTETVTQPAFGGKIANSATKYLNNNENIPDAEADLFQIQFFTQNGTLIQNRSLTVGTAYNRSFTYEQQEVFSSYHMWKYFGWNSGGGGTFFTTWSIGTTHYGGSQGFNGNISPRMAALIDGSQTLTMTFYRIATVTVKNGSVTPIAIEPELIQNLTLTRNGNQFTYTR
jgi:hypothetical protein